MGVIRIVCIPLVIAGWLAAQLAALPHAHPGDGPHDPRPHVHLGGLMGHSHPHAHFHATKDPLSADESACGLCCLPAHDDDACYCAADVTSALASKGPANDSQPSIRSLAATARCGTAASTAPADVAPLERSEWLSGPPRFLMLRTLRI
jgi:hypothetical protein